MKVQHAYKIIIFELFLLLSPTGCRTNQSESKSLNSAQPVEAHSQAKTQPEKVYDLWQKYVQEETKNNDIQLDGCMPTHYPSQGTSKGIVILIHGFTACPQQYFDVAPKIAQAGFDVFLPLMPGQGRIQRDGVKEDFALPKGALAIFRYKNFVHKMVQLAQSASGTKVIGGLSGGGSLAAGAAVEGKDVFNRAILMAPLFKFPHIIQPFIPVINRFYPEFTGPKAENCLKELKKPNTRRGYCVVSVETTYAMLEYGEEYKDKIQDVQFPIQFVGAELDPVVDNRTIIGSFKKKREKNNNTNLCFFKRGVPHSMMSRKENMATGHWWMNSLEKDLVNFITDATWFPADPQHKSIEFREDRCLVDD